MIIFLPRSLLKNPLRFQIIQLQYIVYIIYCAFVLYNFSRKLKVKTTNAARVIKWQRNILIGLAVIWISVYLQYLIELAAIYSMSIYILIFVMIEKHKFLSYKSKHDDIASNELKEKLLKFMNEQKPYLEPAISLPAIAERMDISQHLLSHVINNFFQCNFPEFVNSFRIEDAKKMLKDDRYNHYTIAGIAVECGFNNLSTFNLAFKKNMNSTPKKYREASQTD
ncbi:MAG: helix-turn-helix domain-containing protein [Ignavibacteria bacterium]